MLSTHPSRPRPWRVGLLLLAALLLGLIAACDTPQVSRAAPSNAGFQKALSDAGTGLRIPARGKAIIVNIPSFELVAVENGAERFRSRVIVGKPRTPTPVLTTHATEVRIRPAWRPTPDMISSGAVYDQVVPPGRKNPLGLAALRLEPTLVVYLHDTNRRDLFERDVRAFSYGCIRVERWAELMGWVLDEDPNTIRAWGGGTKSFIVEADHIPVHLVYETVFPAADGSLRRHADIYGRESAAVSRRSGLDDQSLVTCASR